MYQPVDENQPDPDEKREPVRQIDELYGYGRSWREIADAMERGDASARPASTERPGLDGGDSKLRQLCGAEHADEVVRVVLDLAADQLDTCVLFRVKDSVAEPWAARSSAGDLSLPQGIAFPVGSGTPLELLVVHAHYRGAVPAEPAYRAFFARLGLPVPRDILLLPILLGDRLIGIVYGDGGPDGAIRGSIEGQLRLQQKLTLGLTLVLIKNKIQQ